MILHKPFKISPSLLPALEIEGVWLECVGDSEFRFLLKGSEIVIEGYQHGPMHSLQDQFEGILAFLSAWVEALNYPGESDNIDLFDKNNHDLVSWAENNIDEITVLEIELQENNGLIED